MAPPPFPTTAGVLPRPRPAPRRGPAPRPARQDFWRVLAMPRPPRAPGALGVPPAQKWEQLGRGAGCQVAGLRCLGGCPSSPSLPLSQEASPRGRGDAGEQAAEGPLRERASSYARHGAGWSRRMGPQPRRALPAGEAAALLALVKTDPRGGCREGLGGGQASFQTSGFLRSFPSPHLPPAVGPPSRVSTRDLVLFIPTPGPHSTLCGRLSSLSCTKPN